MGEVKEGMGCMVPTKGASQRIRDTLPRRKARLELGESGPMKELASMRRVERRANGRQRKSWWASKLSRLGISGVSGYT